jgi:RimJ/RimL family protein N-acetyltransferase
MKSGVAYAFDFLKIKKLKLEVFEENLRAQSLYKKYGFKEVSKKSVDERKVICMELVKDVVK